MYAKNCICCESISIRCGDDYLDDDGRALAFEGDDWPDTIVMVKLIFESAEKCGCTPKCSVSITGTIFAAGDRPEFGAGETYTSIAGTVTPFVYKTAWFDIPSKKASIAANLNSWRLVGYTASGSQITLQEGPMA